MAKTITELKDSILSTWSEYNQIRERQNEDEEKGLTNYDLIDRYFQLEGIFKRQIINFVKRYGAKWSWSEEDVQNYIKFLHTESCGWCWMHEIKDILKYA